MSAPSPSPASTAGGNSGPSCRLPPGHECTGIGSGNARPGPAVGMNYSRGSGVRATGGVAQGSWQKPERNAGEGLPYLKILVAILVLILPGLAWLALNGY